LQYRLQYKFFKERFSKERIHTNSLAPITWF
jgi:hypothetical protein